MRTLQLHVDERGTASVELVAMLPVFIVLFYAVFYLHGLGAAAQGAKLASRGCAWAHAMGACPDDAPALCAQLALQDAESLDMGQHAPIASSDSWFDEINEIPLIGAAVESLFGSGVTIEARRSAKTLMSSDHVTLGVRNYVVCNTKAATVEQWLTDLAKHMVGGDF